MDLQAIKNFVAMGDDLASAGQPTETELSAVQAHGFKIVVNLGLLDPRYCLPDEARVVAELGMAYHHIPVDFQSPRLTDYGAFLQVMRNSKGAKTFVHCAANFRVSCFLALFGEQDLGWSREQADAHINSLWEPNEVWSDFLESVRAGWQRGA